MQPERHRSQRAAVRAAMREVERRILAEERVCVEMHKSVGAVSLFDVKRGKRILLARFDWEIA